MAVHAAGLHDGRGDVCLEHVGGCCGGTGAAWASRRRGKVRQMAGWAFEQAHRANGWIRLHLQLPFPGAGAERSDKLRVAGLHLLRGDRARAPRRNVERHLGARLSGVVRAAHHHGLFHTPGVHHAQQALLISIAAGVEKSHPLQGGGRRDDIVHAGEEPVAGADVGVHPDVVLGGQFQAPVAHAGADARGKAAIGRAVFQVRGVEVGGVALGEVEQCLRAGGAGVVEGGDAHVDVLLGAIDHAQKTLTAVRVVLGWKERHMVRLGFA